MPDIPPNARCLQCNYPLHGLPDPRCPECGEPFNPADADTMNLGRVPGRIARWLLRHTGWPTLGLVIVATVALLVTSGPPRLVTPEWADTLYLLDGHWQVRSSTAPDTVYIIAVVAFSLTVICLTLRSIARISIQRRYLLRESLSFGYALRRTLLVCFIVLSAAVIFTTWPLRVCRLWVAVAPPQSSSAPPHCPINLPRDEELTALQIGVTSSLRTRHDRIATFALFLQHYPIDAINLMEQTISKETDPEFRALAIHIVSITHQKQLAPLFERLLSDASPVVRAAAADGIDILRGPGLDQANFPWSVGHVEIIADPPVIADNLFPNKSLLSPVVFNDSCRSILEKMMTGGVTSDEREAAARALVNWPPPTYDLRVAEWGIWIADSGANLELTKTILDEIPPFVHRIGDTFDSFAGRYPFYAGKVTKPIIHLTVDRPLALNVEVYIDEGRPWFAYPKPDDLTLSRRERGVRRQRVPIGPSPNTAELRRSLMKELDPPDSPALPDLREGYPWLGPRHRYKFNVPNYGPNKPDASSLGLLWQSLIVLPSPANWMQPPSVSNDPKFKWWSDLRNVPSSFTSSRGESERFIYYDGPTHAKPPLAATLKDNGLHFQLVPHSSLSSKAETYDPEDEVTPLRQARSPARDRREAFFIRVADGKARAMRFALSDDAITQTLPAHLPIDYAAVISQFKKLLTDYGLTAEESDGLIAAWRVQLFQTNGQRLLLRLSAQDYDTLCPISIKPPPTTLVRLGFVLTEF